MQLLGECYFAHFDEPVKVVDTVYGNFLSELGDLEHLER